MEVSTDMSCLIPFLQDLQVERAEALNLAVSPENTPGRALDVKGDSETARAAQALQEVVQGGVATDHAEVVSHKEDVFRRIRLQFGRSQEQYNASLSEGPLRLVGEEEAAGKSSAFFVFSEDGRYCVKRVDPKEAQMLLRIVDDYEAYIHQCKGTLLPRFYGLYEVRLHTGKPTWLMVQGNVLGGRARVIQRFDLKGSTHGRRASAKERAKGRSCVLKDLDFVEASCHIQGQSAEASAEWATWVQAMESDSQFLASHSLIDYSLLLGFSTCSAESRKKPLSHIKRLEVAAASLGNLPIQLAEDECLLMYAGIIDCLMPYNWFKRLENLLLDAVLSADISCQPPKKCPGRLPWFVE
ncbi:Pip5k1c [Symbiodinium natans]|uniref:Pip5k1c protein n=1 Tax=Symbiodinium natans TaxID=878477 RepID=A0A812HI86_9DINO|nr:Pip5k1c [Symbiodinium natans]